MKLTIKIEYYSTKLTKFSTIVVVIVVLFSTN